MANVFRMLWFRGILYSNYTRPLSQGSSLCCHPFSTEVPATTATLEELEDFLKQRNKDMPMPDLTNPYLKERKTCILCKYNVKLDYKNTKLLSQFISRFTGKVYDKRITKLCEEQQKRVEKCVFLSRRAGYMPYVYKDLEFINDPKLYDIRSK